MKSGGWMGILPGWKPESDSLVKIGVSGISCDLNQVPKMEHITKQHAPGVDREKQ